MAALPVACIFEKKLACYIFTTFLSRSCASAPVMRHIYTGGQHTDVDVSCVVTTGSASMGEHRLARHVEQGYVTIRLLPGLSKRFVHH